MNEIRTSKNGINLSSEIDENPNKRSCKSAINLLLLKPDISPITYLLGRWSLILLAPGGNLRTGNTALKVGSIRTYLSSVWRPLHSAFRGKNIFIHEAEEASELLEACLPQDDELRAECATLLNRMFADLSTEIEELPRVHIHGYTTNRDTKQSIDADIITNAEHSLTKEIAQTWKNREGLSIGIQNRIDEDIQISDVLKQYGLRRGEVLNIQTGDLYKTPNDNVSFLHVRWHFNHTIKSSASHRIIASKDSNFPFNTLNNDLIKNTDLIWKGVQENQSPHSPIKVLSTTLRLATGDPKSRTHRYRHTLFSTKFFEINIDQSISRLERISELLRLSGTLGHADIRTSASLYGHTTQYLQCLIYSDDASKLKGKALSNITNISHANLRRRKSRSDKFEDSLFLSIKTQKYLPANTPVETHDPPEWLIDTPKLDFPTIVKLISDYARGKEYQELIYRIFGDQKGALEFLTTLQSVSHLSNCWLIPPKRLKKDIETCEYLLKNDFPSADSLDYSFPSRNIPKAIVQSWIKYLNSSDNIEKLLIDWGKTIGSLSSIECMAPSLNALPKVKCANKSQALTLQKSIELICPIVFVNKTLDDNGWSLSLITDNVSKRVQGITVKFILYAILVFAYEHRNAGLKGSSNISGEHSNAQNKYTDTA